MTRPAATPTRAGHGRDERVGPDRRRGPGPPPSPPLAQQPGADERQPRRRRPRRPAGAGWSAGGRAAAGWSRRAPRGRSARPPRRGGAWHRRPRPAGSPRAGRGPARPRRPRSTRSPARTATGIVSSRAFDHHRAGDGLDRRRASAPAQLEGLAAALRGEDRRAGPRAAAAITAGPTATTARTAWADAQRACWASMKREQAAPQRRGLGAADRDRREGGLEPRAGRPGRPRRGRSPGGPGRRHSARCQRSGSVLLVGDREQRRVGVRRQQDVGVHEDVVGRERALGRVDEGRVARPVGLGLVGRIERADDATAARSKRPRVSGSVESRARRQLVADRHAHLGRRCRSRSHPRRRSGARSGSGRDRDRW